MWQLGGRRHHQIKSKRAIDRQTCQFPSLVVVVIVGGDADGAFSKDSSCLLFVVFCFLFFFFLVHFLSSATCDY